MIQTRPDRILPILFNIIFCLILLLLTIPLVSGGFEKSPSQDSKNIEDQDPINHPVIHNVIDPVHFDLKGIIFEDLNNNHLKDDAEPGLHNWFLKLIIADTKEAEYTNTSYDGTFCFFDVQNGRTYLLSVQPPNGWSTDCDEKNPKKFTVSPDLAMFMIPASQIIENIVPDLKYIWSFNGIENDSITMALNQDGNELFGQAKYEPEGGISWNAEVIGSVDGNNVELTMASQKDKELITTKMTGTFANDSIRGNFIQISGGKKVGTGNFNAMWISRDIQSYIPASHN